MDDHTKDSRKFPIYQFWLFVIEIIALGNTNLKHKFSFVQTRMVDGVQ
jgi:hypothetical protein